MSRAISSALQRLEQSCDRLGRAIQQNQQREQQKPSKTASRPVEADLFAVRARDIAPGQRNGNGQINIDPAILASRLDHAIEKVEELLKD